MSDVKVLAEGCHLLSGCGFPAPSLDEFTFRPIFSIGSFHFNKPELLSLICVALVVWFFWAAFSKPKIVPRGVQNVAEVGVLFVRDQIGRAMLGKNADRYLPFLVSIFFFIWIMNLMEIVPVAAFPVTSLVAFPASIMIMVYLTYWYQGVKKHGFFGFLWNAVPKGVPVFILPLLILVEFARVILVQPFTLAIRLFANMFAGHMLLATFMAATWYMTAANFGAIFAVGSFAMVVALTAFEMLIQALQAYIFTLLTAQYIAESLEGGH